MNNSSNKKCSHCSEKNFSNGRAAAERETLRQNPRPKNNGGWQDFNGWTDFKEDGGIATKKKVFEYKEDQRKRTFGTFNDPTSSSGEMDSYAVVPITKPDRSQKFSNAPERHSKQRRSYNNSGKNVSKFSDHIDSSKLNPDFVEEKYDAQDTVIEDFGFNQDYEVELVDFRNDKQREEEELRQQEQELVEEEQPCYEQTQVEEDA